jgi:hypothetical protein
MAVCGGYQYEILFSVLRNNLVVYRYLPFNRVVQTAWHVFIIAIVLVPFG